MAVTDLLIVETQIGTDPTADKSVWLFESHAQHVVFCGLFLNRFRTQFERTYGPAGA